MKPSFRTWLLSGVPAVAFLVTLGLWLDCRRKLEVEHERLLRVADLLETWSAIGNIERNPDGTMPNNGGALTWKRVTETWSPREPGAEYYVLARSVSWPMRRRQLEGRYATQLIENGYVTAQVGADGRVGRLFFDKP
jgi:hypothetical protein